MRKVLNHIRNKPYDKRNRIIWIIAGIATAILVLLWVLVGNGKKSEDANFFRAFNQGFEEGKDDFKNPLE